jgi:hypothetical protein
MADPKVRFGRADFADLGVSSRRAHTQLRRQPPARSRQGDCSVGDGRLRRAECSGGSRRTSGSCTLLARAPTLAAAFTTREVEDGSCAGQAEGFRPRFRRRGPTHRRYAPPSFRRWPEPRSEARAPRERIGASYVDAFMRQRREGEHFAMPWDMRSRCYTSMRRSVRGAMLKP